MTNETNNRDPFRTPGIQAEPPSGLCETCVHMRPAYGGAPPKHFHCYRNAEPEPVDPVLRFISSELAKPQTPDPEFCTHIRDVCGEVCPDYSEASS